MAKSSLAAVVAVALLSLTSPSVHAQQARTIDVPATKKWQHAETGLIVPETLAGLPRAAITDSTAAELDISIQFGDPATTNLTLYVFRPALMSVPIWFDRVETQISGRDVFGRAVPRGDTVAFAPPRATTPAALRRIYVPAKPPFLSTGAAMMPLGEWLIAARISSTALDPAALEVKLVEAINGLGWPAPGANAAEQTLAAPVQPCATPAAFSDKAKVKKPDMTVALMGAFLANAANDPKVKKTPVEGPRGFCREGDPGLEAAAYRPLAGGEGYVMAVGDAGRTISVARELALGKKEPGYSVTFNDLAISYIFPSFDGLPAPDRTFEMVRKTRPISSSARGSKTLTINTP